MIACSIGDRRNWWLHTQFTLNGCVGDTQLKSHTSSRCHFVTAVRPSCKCGRMTKEHAIRYRDDGFTMGMPPTQKAAAGDSLFHVGM